VVRVQSSLRSCFSACAGAFESVGRDIRGRMRDGNFHEADIKTVLQGLQDSYFLQNFLFPELCKVVEGISKSSRIDLLDESHLVKSMHNFKRLYVDLNSAREEDLREGYLRSSTEPASTTNLFDIRSHVFRVLHFFVEQHSLVSTFVPHLCKELLTLLVESFFGDLSQMLDEEGLASKVSSQDLLEMSYLETALGKYVSPKAHKIIDKCNTYTRASLTPADKARLKEALLLSKLHWQCFSN